MKLSIKFQAMALENGDRLFPSYRQQGLLFVRGRPVVDMMCHCISNAGDNLKGRQMPVFYSWKAGNFFSISGNLATRFSQAVGWTMASACKDEDHIARKMQKTMRDISHYSYIEEVDVTLLEALRVMLNESRLESQPRPSLTHRRRRSSASTKCSGAR